MTPDEIWETIVGEEYGAILRSALATLALVPSDVMIDAINKISRETAVGPLLNPSAYLDGRRWDNARQYQQVLGAAAELRRLLPEEPR